MSGNDCLDSQSLNFLNDNSFTFKILSCKNTTFFCTKANIPELNIEIAKQSTVYNAVSYPGDELNYGDLIVTFKLQENLKDYLEIFNWLTTSAHPINLSDLYKQQYNVKNNRNPYIGESNNGGIFSDAILTVLDNSLNPKFEVKFFDCFPVRLSSIEFNTEIRGTSPISCTASFKYTYFQISSV